MRLQNKTAYNKDILDGTRNVAAEGIEDNAAADDDFVAPVTRSKKPDVIPLLVPRNIVKTEQQEV